MKRVYYAAPLFNNLSRSFNEAACKKIERLGYEVYLPQRDGGSANDEGNGEEVRKAIFKKDYDAVKACDFLIAFTYGAHIDEGTAVEIGLAIAWEKPYFIVTENEARTFAQGAIFNLMIDTKAEKIFNTIDDCVDYLKSTNY